MFVVQEPPFDAVLAYAAVLVNAGLAFLLVKLSRLISYSWTLNEMHTKIASNQIIFRFALKLIHRSTYPRQFLNMLRSPNESITFVETFNEKSRDLLQSLLYYTTSILKSNTFVEIQSNCLQTNFRLVFFGCFFSFFFPFLTSTERIFSLIYNC